MPTKLEDLKFYSKKQEAVVKNNLAEECYPYAYYKLHKQVPDGSIVLHRFYNYGEQWLGYALTVGKRGGTKVYHNCYVVTNPDSSLDLHHS